MVLPTLPLLVSGMRRGVDRLGLPAVLQVRSSQRIVPMQYRDNIEPVSCSIKARAHPPHPRLQARLAPRMIGSRARWRHV